MSDRIITEGRIFTSQLMREIRQRERLGAGELTPGARTWQEALLGFRDSFPKPCGPIQAGRIFNRAGARLIRAHKEHAACYINLLQTRKRSGAFDLITWKVAQHPLRSGRYEGIQLSGQLCLLSRNSTLRMYGRTHAFMSWHALGRLYERWDKGTVDHATVAIGLVGIAGMLMSTATSPHSNSAMNMVFEGVHFTGIMRHIPNKYKFFDCLTVLPWESGTPRQMEQGILVADAVLHYLKNGDGPSGYAERVPVLPFTHKDYVTRDLT